MPGLVKVSVSRLIKAPRERVWSLLADLERWPDWAPEKAMNRVISHPVVSREGNTIVCDEYEQAGLIKAHHRDSYTLSPETGTLTETIIQGDFQGGIKVTLTSTPEGILAHVDADVSPRNPWLRVLSAVLGGGRLLTQFWVDLFGQLAAVAESPCSPLQPMYCPSRMLNAYFEVPSLPMQTLVNKGGREIDVPGKVIYSDLFWKGIYPPDSLAPAWIFQNGFNKRFAVEDGTLKGLTSTFDDTIKGENKLSMIDPNDQSKGVILEYVAPQYSLFYDILKITSDDMVVGKAFTGKYPHGVHLLNFTMARRYSFDFMSDEDHRELWEKYGKMPDVRLLAGEWEGRMVSNASLTPPQFRFWYSVDSSGRLGCKWSYMNILKGTSKLKLTGKELEMFDFTNFHDEIRMLADDAMVGRYLPKSEKIMNLIGNRDLGLIHFEKTSEGTRPVIYYYIKKVAGPQ
jgi:uncharacterized protein YndB with AHSA1/START domain